MLFARRTLAVLAAVGTSVVLAACTPSVSSDYDGADPWIQPIVPHAPSASTDVDERPGTLGAKEPRTGSGTVQVAVLAGHELPASLTADFTSRTGFALEFVPVDAVSGLGASGADIAFGFDLVDILSASGAGALAPTAPQDVTAPEGTAVSAAPAAIPYGRDDVCVLADRSWMSANRRALPFGLEGVSAADTAALLAIPDPGSTPEGRAFVELGAAHYGEAVGEWAKRFASAGSYVASGSEAVAAWTAQPVGQSGGTAGTLPLMVGSMSQVTSVATGSGVESQAGVVPSTCVARPLYAAGLATSDDEIGVESFLAWLHSWRAQRSLAQVGLVYPADASAAEGTAAQWFLAPADDALVINEAAAGATQSRVEMWSAGFAGAAD